MLSARSQGEPLTGRCSLNWANRPGFALLGNDEERYLICSDAGYGFICSYSDLVSKNKNGKALLTVPEGEVMAPQRIQDVAQSLCLVISNEGRMLLFPLAELPELARWRQQADWYSG